ncbi:hypothetical protein MJO28_007101 [Puccinia striiformis f. sp. tritici]|uniref:Uncharacterized protein n=3 Tax=Puccinia striiformis TaxID=27350 RepID=A0A0L0VRT0_9BASI|nr:hypothetical protein Pst134EB_014211 [Puccinia striiformis f. sp. tritici]KAI7951417.1 hypothetical protein MJO28_007101 [Puccinia striiformis f. sp. tritici]KAI7955658.1 hypothetical protein MJO29_007057 [Puccinia striiformis f. sp. tritici]KNF01964.1 hypothetical protein PSTG_04788 [Puccinia striiformis f. sp. tritici PST-78]POV94324.1 hypothetical protein PSHT_16297 [Puccinia striiformis]
MSSITARKDISNRLNLYEQAELIGKCEGTLIVEDTKYGSVEELLLQESTITTQVKNCMLKTQVMSEVHLKSWHLQQLGSVHKQNISTASLEAENQNLKNSKILTGKNKLEYNNLIKQKFLELKKINLGVLNSNSSSLDRVNELEKIIDLHNLKLCLIQYKNHDSKNRIKLIEPDLQIIDTLKSQVSSLSNALLTWDDKLRKFKKSNILFEILGLKFIHDLSVKNLTKIENRQLRFELLFTKYYDD